MTGFLFSRGILLFPGFVNREQFVNAQAQGFEDLVTLRYAITSLILALAFSSFYLRSLERDVIG